jgi:hypothetical protein
MAGAEVGGLPVSPPGAMSQRTDLSATQAPMSIPASYYGEGQELQEIQAGADMYARPAPKKPTGLFAPSARPNEPITSGVDFGDGPGSEALAAGPQNQRAPRLQDTLSRLMSANPGDSRMQRLLAAAQKYGW